MFNRQVGLLRAAILEIRVDRQCEWQDRQRKSLTQVSLVREDGIRIERIEALLIREVEHGRECVERALENRGPVQVHRGIETVPANRGRRRGEPTARGQWSGDGS